MADGFRFAPHLPGIEKVSKGPAIMPELDKAAEKAAGKMRGFASGMKRSAFFDFRGSIRVVRSRMEGDEAVAYVGSGAPGWHLQEFGTARQRPRAVIRRGMKASGIKFEEGH